MIIYATKTRISLSDRMFTPWCSAHCEIACVFMPNDRDTKASTYQQHKRLPRAHYRQSVCCGKVCGEMRARGMCCGGGWPWLLDMVVVAGRPVWFIAAVCWDWTGGGVSQTTTHIIFPHFSLHASLLFLSNILIVEHMWMRFGSLDEWYVLMVENIA